MRKIKINQMKVFSNLRFLLMVAVTAIMLVSCGEDIGGGTGSETQTTVNLQAGTDLVTSVTTIAPGATFAVNLVATAGDDAMKTVEVFEDGVSIPVVVGQSRIQYDGTAAAANPKLLFGDEINNLDFNIQVVAHTEVGTRTYRFTVADDAGDTESVSVEVTTVGTPPALTLDGPVTLDLAPGKLNSVRLTAVKGAGSISAISVLVDGEFEDIADLAFGGDFTSNPQPLEGAMTEGFVMESLSFRTRTTLGTYVYTIVVTDEYGQNSTTEFTVNVVSTPLETLTGVLYNAEGPTGTGGLDLDNGNSTGSASGEAEIRDQGYDDAGNWAQLIAPVADATMFQLTPGANGIAEGFTFASITSKQDLANLSESGLPIGVSGTVLVGDMFVVNRAGLVYGILVTEVNVQADNSDNYVFTIIK